MLGRVQVDGGSETSPPVYNDALRRLFRLRWADFDRCNVLRQCSIFACLGRLLVCWETRGGITQIAYRLCLGLVNPPVPYTG